MATNTEAEVSTATVVATLVRDGTAPNKNVYAATELQAPVMEKITATLSHWSLPGETMSTLLLLLIQARLQGQCKKLHYMQVQN